MGFGSKAAPATKITNSRYNATRFTSTSSAETSLLSLNGGNDSSSCCRLAARRLLSRLSGTFNPRYRTSCPEILQHRSKPFALPLQLRLIVDERLVLHVAQRAPGHSHIELRHQGIARLFQRAARLDVRNQHFLGTGHQLPKE